jgi:anthranilate phosphoribosyltransferase
VNTNLNRYIDEFQRGRDLAGGDAEAFLDSLISESDEPLLTDIFRAWDAKGITEDEIYSIAKIMRDRCTPLISRHEAFIDIVGTGGSRSKTFNVSTAAAFVVAGAGIAVAKHGNKAATSNSGSADVLSALGVEPAVEPAAAERCLNEIGICFMFAPNFHRLSPTLGKVRRGLGFPTIFNCVGPLCNPARAPHQIIGVWDHQLVPKMANALARLGTKRSWIVYGHDGLDEISLAGPTMVAEVVGRSVQRIEITPKDFNLEPGGGLVSVNTADESAEMIRSVLNARNANGPAVDIVKLNAAAAIYIVGDDRDPINAIRRASDSIESGSAFNKLRQLAEATKR